MHVAARESTSLPYSTILGTEATLFLRTPCTSRARLLFSAIRRANARTFGRQTMVGFSVSGVGTITFFLPSAQPNGLVRSSKILLPVNIQESVQAGQQQQITTGFSPASASSYLLSTLSQT